MGGAIVSLLLDNPGISPVRATDDVAVVLEVVATLRRHRGKIARAQLRT